jgi:hypothetical protein
VYVSVQIVDHKPYQRGAEERSEDERDDEVCAGHGCVEEKEENANVKLQGAVIVVKT